MMQCYRRSPEDTALRCTRKSTQRFAEVVQIHIPLQMSDRVTVWAYTCDQHAEHGPALAHAETEIWESLTPIRTLSTFHQVYDPEHVDANGDGWVTTQRVEA